MYITILGRQPELGIAELEAVFGDVQWFSDQSALVNTPSIDIERLGGALKAGRVVAELPRGDWQAVSTKVIQHYSKAWAGHDGKITLGISAYGLRVSTRDIQKTGVVLKSKLKAGGVSLRLIPNTDPALSTATSHHNKLGLSNNKVELLIVRAQDGRIVVAESTGSQNITALARRDQGRPKRDAFVGMLPPKLAQMMVNLGVGQPEIPPTILDPFCGTGVILQEALLLGYTVAGTDLAEKMVDYTEQNLDWLADVYHLPPAHYPISAGDAMNTTWQQPIDAVVCESYLGQPFSAPPSSAKLTEVRGNCNHIISGFLKNIGAQIKAGTPLCVAVPAWRATDGSFTHLPLIGNLEKLGYKQREFKTVRSTDLLYHRPEQVVARELLVLTKM